MPPAARMGDMVLQDAPHCHAPIHPPAPVPTAVPHPALPLPIIKGVPTVLIGGQPAATVTSNTGPCTLPGCVPGGPGMVMKGSATVMIGGLPAARVGEAGHAEGRGGGRAGGGEVEAGDGEECSEDGVQGAESHGIAPVAASVDRSRMAPGGVRSPSRCRSGPKPYSGFPAAAPQYTTGSLMELPPQTT